MRIRTYCAQRTQKPIAVLRTSRAETLTQKPTRLLQDHLMYLDLNRSYMRHKVVCERVVEAIDTALAAERDAQEPRDYLGASAIGHECMRKIQYDQRHGIDFPPRILRIFERGHNGEELAIAWLRKAGFVLQTAKPNGGQLGFVSGKGKYKGHVDGVILESPVIEIQTPCGWECKVLGEKGYKKVAKDGLRSAYPVYYSQISQYAAYMDLADNPFMFFAVNANTMEIYVEMIPFDGKHAQKTTDKAVTIIEANEHGELLPRAFNSPDFYLCKWCDHHERCWEGKL